MANKQQRAFNKETPKEPNSKHYTIFDEKCIMRAPIMSCLQPKEDRADACSGLFARIFPDQSRCQFCMKRNGEELPELEFDKPKKKKEKQNGFS